MSILMVNNMRIARIYRKNPEVINPKETWYQFTMKFVYHDEALKEEVTKYNVFERRECDTTLKNWKICYIE